MSEAIWSILFTAIHSFSQKAEEVNMTTILTDEGSKAQESRLAQSTPVPKHLAHGSHSEMLP
jgi:hypothetical protein